MIIMSSMLGIQIYGGLLPRDGRSNFHTLLPSEHGYGALVTVFQIMTGENWNEIMYLGLDTVGNASVVYFIRRHIRRP